MTPKSHSTSPASFTPGPVNSTTTTSRGQSACFLQRAGALSSSAGGAIALLLVLLAAVILLSPATAACAEGREAAENDIRAAYLYHFAKFVEWPVEPSAAPLSICVIGKSSPSFVNTLGQISGRVVRNRSIGISFIGRIEEAQACDILYVSGSERARLEHIITSVATRPILTVSDIRGFVAAGGMIGFISGNEKLRFQINQRASQRSNLRISAQLLKLATSVGE